jgi:hypothetical protein
MKNIWFEGVNWGGEWDYPHPGDWECRTRGPSGTYRKRCQCDPSWVQDKFLPALLEEFRKHPLSGGRGLDEYGNCTLYVRTPLFGVVWRYPTFYRQTDVEVPLHHDSEAAGEWICRVFEGRESWLESYPYRRK